MLAQRGGGGGQGTWASRTQKHSEAGYGRPERGNDTSKSTGRSGRQNAATGRNMRKEERVTVQGPVKEQQPDGMSHRGGGGRAKNAKYTCKSCMQCREELQDRSHVGFTERVTL